MIFRKEVYFTRDMEKYNRAKAALADHGIEYTSKSNPMTNPGRYHGTPFINASERRWTLKSYLHIITRRK